ncbi:MAG: 2Fe-2S iron-sulfur cluster binding domain-containing protein [Clostridia bacterium]|nr:MAG: 2Fe-2S iron-sulfur cluster binding domain-containing protein [Clostridia bacterium]
MAAISHKGTCGRCAIKIKEGKVRTREGNIGARLRRTGHVLACQTLVEGDVLVEVPRDSRLDEHPVLLARRAESGELAEKELDLLEG